MVDPSRLKLVLDHWYGWQMIPGYGQGRYLPYFSPIFITAVTAKKTGKRILEIGFFNAFYPEGVQDFKLNIRILKHSADWLLADLVDYGDTGRAAVINHIEFDWIQKLCPQLWWHRPPTSCSELAQGSVSIYLNEVYRITPSG